MPFMQICINGIFIWSYQKNVVYLHREPALGMSAHQRRRVANIIKGVISALCLAIRNLVNFIDSNTLQHFDVLGICISISVHLK